MNQSTIILLNGASSAGKTSLCKQLQIVLDDPYMHLEEDRFVFNTYHERFLNGSLGEQIFAKTMLGYYRSLAACASAGHNILADTGFYSRALVDQCAQELAELQVWLVGVHCSLAELERRERERGDRMVGLAQQQFHAIHEHAMYDVEVDTSVASLLECVEQIKATVTSATMPQALHQLNARVEREATVPLKQ